jgi:hypothetical protein
VNALKTHSWPWFGLALALFLVALLGRLLEALSPYAAGVVAFVAAMTFIGACIHALHGSADDVAGMEKVGRGMGIWS